MNDHRDGGWCPGFQRHAHFVDLLISSNAPLPLCTACNLAWLRSTDRTDR